MFNYRLFLTQKHMSPLPTMLSLRTTFFFYDDFKFQSNTCIGYIRKYEIWYISKTKKGANFIITKSKNMKLHIWTCDVTLL